MGRGPQVKEKKKSSCAPLLKTESRLQYSEVSQLVFPPPQLEPLWLPHIFPGRVGCTFTL